MKHINTYSENSLHAELKAWYAQPGDSLETEIDGSIIDLVRGQQLIEIQTRNFAALKPKLSKLLDTHPIQLVHPIAHNRWIVKKDGTRTLSRRKSPRHGTVYHLFSELVYIHPFVIHPNLSLHILLIEDEEIRQNDGQGSWRRKGWSIQDRRLLSVLEQHTFYMPDDFLNLLPDSLPPHFTTANLAEAAHIPRRIAQQMVYCLKHMALIDLAGKQGRALLYRLASP